jgi:hypothetical protein
VAAIRDKVAMMDIGAKVYEALRSEQPSVGTTVFGTDPLKDGEATIAGYTSGHVDLQVMVGRRLEKISIDKQGKILGYAVAVQEGERAPLAIVESNEIGQDDAGPFIEVQPLRSDEPNQPQGPRRRLRYVGPALG